MPKGKKKRMAFCPPGEEAETKAKLVEAREKSIRKKLGVSQQGSHLTSSNMNSSNMSISYLDDSLINTDAKDAINKSVSVG